MAGTLMGRSGNVSRGESGCGDTSAVVWMLHPEHFPLEHLLAYEV